MVSSACGHLLDPWSIGNLRIVKGKTIRDSRELGGVGDGILLEGAIDRVAGALGLLAEGFVTLSAELALVAAGRYAHQRGLKDTRTLRAYLWAIHLIPTLSPTLSSDWSSFMATM